MPPRFQKKKIRVGEGVLPNPRVLILAASSGYRYGTGWSPESRERERYQADICRHERWT